MIFVRPTVILVFDRLADELFLIAPIWPDAAAPIDRMIDAAQDRLDTIAARLSSASAHTDRATTGVLRSEEHTSELQSLIRSSYAVFFLNTKKFAYTIHFHFPFMSPTL